MKKVTKILAVMFGGISVTFLLLVIGMIHFVFTPEKLTPVVLQVANRVLDADLKLKKVELTFFSTFPRLGLRVEQGTLVSKSSHQFASHPTDSLLGFRECVMTVSPLDYLFQHKVTIHKLALYDATVYAYRNREGQANWDIIRSSDHCSQEEKDTVSSDSWKGEIDIQQVELQKANVVFDDRNTDVYMRVEDADLRLRLSLTSGISLLDMDFANRNVLFWQRGKLLVNQVATALKAQVEVDRTTACWTLKQTMLKVNGICLDVQGTMQRDTMNREVDLNLFYGLHAPSMEKVLLMIPEHLVKRRRVKADGHVQVDGTIQGRYGNQELPAITLRILVKDAKARYEGMPYGIDSFTAEFDSYVDLMRKKPSFFNLNILRLTGTHIDVSTSIRVDDLLADPLIQLHTESSVDLNALAQTFPWQEGVVMQGGLDAGLNLRCRLSSLKKQDIGRLSLTGKMALKNFELKDTSRDFSFYGNADFLFSGKKTLEAELEIRKLLWKSRHFMSEIERMQAKVVSDYPQDSTRVVALHAQLEMNKFRAAQGDSLAVYSGCTKASVRLEPSSRYPILPVVGVTLHADSLFLRAHDHRLDLQVAGIRLNAEKVRDSLWLPHGIVGFNQMCIHTPLFGLPVHLRKTAVMVDGSNLVLKNASLQVGRSDVVATGEVRGLYRAMMSNDQFKARLHVASEFIDCNQLVQALSVSNDSLLHVYDADSVPAGSLAQTSVEATSEGMKLFILPDKVDFEGKVNLKKVAFEQMLFEDVCGQVNLKRGILFMKDMHMRAMEADMQAVMVYHTDSLHGGYTGFDFKIKDINVAKLVDFIPSMDSIVPMLRSFKGRVQFDVAAEARLDSVMNIQIPTLRSAMHIRGDSLVLMDGETFSEISKMLMFKNKKRNVFDSISVNVVVDDGSVLVYPFQVTLDRYKAAIGGKQGLDMNFEYHISVLKSPLPFKAGVNITGTPDKMKIRLGKARYKDDVTPAAIHKVDSTRIDLGRRIVERFHRIVK